MAQVVLFHSVLGLRAGVTDAAARMEAMGHTVHVPDLYGGAVFDDYEQAAAHVASIGGHRELLRRTDDAVGALPARLVYAGFSQGGASAEYLALTRPGAAGVLLFSSAAALTWFGTGGADARWPATVPVQVHYAVADPFREQDELDAFAEGVRAAGAPFQLFEYPGAGHLFTDPSLPDEHDAQATGLLWQRVETFLRDVHDGARGA